jgi:D-3-phosphoglycerate dehydrogenase
MNKKVVIVDHRFPNVELETQVLSKIGVVPIDAKIQSDEEFLAVAGDADAIIVRAYPITEKLISKLTKCKVIVRYGVGVENIDVQAATRYGIYVANVPDYCTEEVAGFAFTLIMCLARKVIPSAQIGRSLNWTIKPLSPIRRVRGQTLGIVGFGRIGRALARMALPFGFKIITYDPYGPQDVVQSAGAVKVEIEELLSSSDFISFHAPLSKETEGIIGAREFARMKTGVYLVNVARGGLFDEAELAAAIKEGKVAGAALDVLTEEPPRADNPLLGLDNVIVTPHVAWLSEEARHDLQSFAAEEVVRVLSGDKLKHCLNPEAQNYKK